MTGSDTTTSRAPAGERTRPLRAFLTELARHPLQMGTVWPSSRALARAMVRRLPETRALPVLELGAGTGAVTQALLEGGLPPRQLIALEKSPRLAEVLRDRFPGAQILAGDALELETLLGGQKVGAVVSSLPLKVFSASDVDRLANSIHALLAPGGCWIQYTYQVFNGHSPSNAFERVGSSLVLFNLPPALVCVYRPVVRKG